MGVIRNFQPELVLCHWVNDVMHPDHEEAAKAVLWASRYCDVPGLETGNAPCPVPQFVCCEAQLGSSPVSKFLPEFFVDIGTTIERKVEAMSELAAQPSLPVQYKILAQYRALEAQTTALMVECGFAEGFTRVGTGAIR